MVNRQIRLYKNNCQNEMPFAKPRVFFLNVVSTFMEEPRTFFYQTIQSDIIK